MNSAAAAALEQLGESKWQQAIKGDNNDWLRLSELGDERAVEPLIDALSLQSGRIRRVAANGLLKIAHKRPEIQYRLLQYKSIIINPHYDHARSSVISASFDCTPGRYHTQHTDEGIGLNWPF